MDVTYWGAVKPLQTLLAKAVVHVGPRRVAGDIHGFLSRSGTFLWAREFNALKQALKKDSLGEGDGEECSSSDDEEDGGSGNYGSSLSVEDSTCWRRLRAFFASPEHAHVYGGYDLADALESFPAQDGMFEASKEEIDALCSAFPRSPAATDDEESEEEREHDVHDREDDDDDDDDDDSSSSSSSSTADAGFLDDFFGAFS